MPSTKQRKGKGKQVASGRVHHLFPPPQDGECPQQEIDEWLNCDTPQNEAAAQAILREQRRDQTRERRARQKPVEKSDYQAPNLPSRAKPVVSPFALPQLAKKVAEMDRVREERGNPFPYPANRKKPFLAVYPEPRRRALQKPGDSYLSCEEASYPQHRSNPPRSSRPENAPVSNNRRNPRTSKLHPHSRAANAAEKSRIFLRIPRKRKSPSPSIDVPVNSFGHFGNIAGEDEVGVRFDYSNLLPNRTSNTATSQITARQGDKTKTRHSGQELQNREADPEQYSEDSEDSGHIEDSEDSEDSEGGEDDKDYQDYGDSEDSGDGQYWQENIYDSNDDNTGEQEYESNSQDEADQYGQNLQEGPYAEMENLPAGAEAILRRLEEDQEDEVPAHRSNSNAWLSPNDPRSLPNRAPLRGSSTGSNSFATSETDRSLAPAFAPQNQRQDPYQHYGHNRSFAFSAAVPMAPQPASWNTMPPPPARRGNLSSPTAGESTPRFSSQYGSDQGNLDVHAARNQALEGTFNSESVYRAYDNRHGNVPSEMGSEIPNRAIPQQFSNEQGFDDRFEDPHLNIDPDIRANFVPLSQLHSAPLKRTAFEMQNPNLVASSETTPISTVIGGETVTYTPNPMDERVKSLDRRGNYTSEYQGDISKRVKRQHVEKVAARDKEMIEANEAYQTLLAMTPEDRTELLERLRRPFVFYGAFSNDQEVVDEIPQIYTRAVSSIRVMNWMDKNSSNAKNPTAVENTSASSATSTSYIGSADESQPLNDFGDLDDFAAGASYVPLEGGIQKLVDKTQEYFQDVIFFGGENARDQSSKGRDQFSPLSSRNLSLNAENMQSPGPGSLTVRQRLSSANLGSRAPPSDHSGSTARAQLGFLQTRPGHSEVGQVSLVSTRETNDPFTFDDSPEFQIPSDIDIDLAVDLNAHQNLLYRVATSHSKKYGRVVLIRLHEPVKFTPGAIAQRVFGGIVQEMQLFPVQRLAIVVFLHCAEAKAFLRHVKRTHEIGNAHEIRSLQIEAGWYKGSEKSSILHAQPNLLRYHITLEATRTLELSHIDLVKSVSQISSELGSRLKKLLLKVILTKPKQKYLQEEQGRKAIVEFASVKDAIEAKDELDAGTVTAYGSQVAYAADPCAKVAAEKAWCKCMGCLEQRADKA